MKRKKQNRKGQKTLCVSCKRHSAFLGLIHDLLWVVQAFVHVFAWPCHALASVIHRELRKHPALRYKHAHSIISVALGLALVALSFTIQALFKHPVWDASVETMRAAGVCPLWETLASAFKLGADFEG